MKTLVVGGTGMIGTHTAVHLRDQGHDVTVAARRTPDPESTAGQFPVLLGDYSEGTFTAADLKGFDSIVFAAGNDIRHVPRDADTTKFWESMQSEGVPNFVALAREAGVECVVQIGSYYHQVKPELAETNPYVEARRRADDDSRALATDGFRVITLNPPSILGLIPGRPVRGFAKTLAWADGELSNVPNFAPAGGTNYLSVRSLAQAIAGAIDQGESGKAYLVGDVNLRFQEYFQMVFDAAGSSITLEERDEEHPFLPDAFIVPGRGFVLAYEPDAADTALLGYDRDDAQRAVAEMVALTRASA